MIVLAKAIEEKSFWFEDKILLTLILQFLNWLPNLILSSDQNTLEFSLVLLTYLLIRNIKLQEHLFWSYFRREIIY